MNNNKKLLYSDSYYNMIQLEPIKNIESYHKFVNWAESEFNLYLQEANSGLKVFYPNGYFSIHCLNKNEKGFYVELKITSKSLKIVNKMEVQLNALLYYFNRHNDNLKSFK